MFSLSETMYETIPEQKENKKEKNIKEWNRINNIWLDIKNKNKNEHPCLYSTDSDNSVDNTPTPTPILSTSCNYILKKSNSFCSYDDEINGGLEIENEYLDGRGNIDGDGDGDGDGYNLDSGLYTPCSSVTQSSIKCKYTIDNAASLELDYSLNYNMKMLTHIGNYYEILKSKHSQGQTKTTKKRNVATKLCKPELIKSIVSFETDAANHCLVYQCKKMLEYIESIKSDKYFSSFVIFP
jgi:hypothetical protein